jgi:hypothetical protein
MAEAETPSPAANLGVNTTLSTHDELLTDMKVVALTTMLSVDEYDDRARRLDVEQLALAHLVSQCVHHLGQPFGEWLREQGADYRPHASWRPATSREGLYVYRVALHIPMEVIARC